MKDPVEIYSTPIAGQLFVVGDIHGCYDLLMRTLQEVGFDKKADLLVAVGDLVDRGKQNEDCVGLIDEPWFKSVRGNHDQMCIDGFIDFHAAQMHADSRNGGEWFYRLPSMIQERITAKLATLPIALEISHKGAKFGFVHAQVKQNDWEDFKIELRNEDSQLMGHSIDDAIWGRDRIYCVKENSRYESIANIDYVFFGHTIVTAVVRKNNCVYLDTGAYHTGKLTILKLL